MSTMADKPEFTPDRYPPLPTGLASVELETVSLSKLEAGDKDEAERVFRICKDQGFFYLDLSSSNAVNLRADSEEIARLSENVFRLPLEEKEKYIPHGKSIFGYKFAGRTVTDVQGTPDTAEFFNVSKNDMIRPDPELSWPQLIHDNKTLLSRFVRGAHETGLLVLSILSSKLGLPPTTLANLHRLHEHSGDHIRMTRGPPRSSLELPEIQTPGHTDFGTITILFNWLGGLQIWSKSNRGQSGFANVVDPELTDDGGHGKWLWVQPKPGPYAIVNLGDAAVKFTNGLFCSGRHRVVPAPGEQGTYPRYSVVYFVRPEDNAVLRCLKSPGVITEPRDAEEEVKAIDWIAMQARGLEQTGQAKS